MPYAYGHVYIACHKCKHLLWSLFELQWNPSIPGTLRPGRTVLIIEVSSFRGLKCAMAEHSESFVSSLDIGKPFPVSVVPVACVHNRGMPAIQEFGLEGFHSISEDFCEYFCFAVTIVVIVVVPVAIVVVVVVAVTIVVAVGIHACRIMTGPLDKSSLGPDPESVEIGHCGSQCGRLSLSVDYRKTIDTFQRYVFEQAVCSHLSSCACKYVHVHTDVDILYILYIHTYIRM